MFAPQHQLRRLLRSLRDDEGSAAVSFIMAFPIFLSVVAIMVQLALMVNAKIMVTSAAEAAGRAAMTSLPEDKPDNLRHAAVLALAPLCPESKADIPAEASGNAAALKTLGVNVPDTFAGRYAYAMEATTVKWNPEMNYSRAEGQETDVTVTYAFPLTVPFARRIAADRNGTIAGVEGPFWTVSATVKVQTAHGRKARADGDGWPR